MATEEPNEDDLALHGSCAARILILIDIANFAAKNGAGGSARDVAICVDSVRLSVLRVLLQLCRSCPQDSWLEWATRFFDSRHSGVGKTPSELRARLRSRLSARPNRGFTRVTQASFQAFGEACLAVSCGVQGDPLARDRETALKRWVHRRKERGTTRQSAADCRAKPHSGDQPAAEERFGGLRSGASGEECPRRMYDGHDMSSQEVVVRSLLEVLQEFGEAGQRDHTGASSMPRVAHDPDASRPQQLLLLHRGFPRTEDDVESFVLRGNFTTEAAAFKHESPEERAEALMELLNAQLGKAILSIRARGVSFLWQDGFATSDPSTPLDAPSTSIPLEGCLHRCLLAAGSRGVIGAGRVTGSSALLPPSAALGRHFTESGGGDRHDPFGLSGANTKREQGRGGTTVGVALNPRGIVDFHVVSTPLSARRCYSGRWSSKLVETAPSYPTKTSPRTTPRSTPWRLMGTVSISQVWPASLVDQGWGAAAVVRGQGGPGCKRWREFLCKLRARDLAAVTTLPLGLFRSTSWTHSSHDDNDDIQEAPTVALIVPVTEECALGWSMEVPEVDAETETEATSLCADDTDGASRFSAQSQVLALEALESMSVMGVMGDPTSEQERENAHSESQEMQVEDSVGDIAAHAGMMLEMRENEVGSAIQEALLERKRRRQQMRRGGLETGARGLDNVGSSASGVAYRGAWSGGTEGSLRESGSRCSAGEDMSCDGAADSIRQWRLEAFSETSRVSGSPRGCRLFASDSEITEDERVSYSESTLGPRRALEQALEDVSSHSSLLGPDADYSSTLSNREASGCSSGATVQQQRVDRAMGTGNRVSEYPTTKTGETSEPVSFVAVAGGGARDLPLSFMSEPALACLPGPPLAADVLSLGKACARTNENAAGPTVIAGRDAYGQSSLFPEAPHDSPASTPQGVGAKQKFIDVIRSLERMERIAEADRHEPVGPPFSAEITTPAISVHGGHHSLQSRHTAQECAVPEALVGEETRPPEDERFCNLGGHDVEVAGGFEHRVSSGVCGLLKQYREVVEVGQRSPVDFVLHAVPEAVRDLTDDARHSSATVDTADDCHARAAQVLAAVVSGLTCTPLELSLKHVVKKGTRPAMEEPSKKISLETSLDRGDRGKGAAGAKGTVATPALQKIRDYQLQALLLCQFHTLALDLPDTPENAAVFYSLEASGRDKKVDDPEGSDSKSGKGKGKGKKRRRKNRKQEQTSAPVRPSDPLPDHRRARLVDLLQPISTLLESRTIIEAPLTSDEGSAEAVGGETNGSRSRAYDGTLADFMGLALVKNFGSRLPRTLLALYEDFEYHPPDALAATFAGPCQGVADAVDAVEKRVGVAASRADGLKRIERYAAASDSSGTGTGTTEAGTEPGGSRPRTMATAGILLSDRTLMSHNHFKNSGVLNGFPKVKLKSKVSSGGGVPGNDGTASGESGSKTRIENAKWRHARGKTETTSRAARDSKKETGRATRDLVLSSETVPSEGVRHSPRLVRHGQGEATHASDNSKECTNASWRRRSSFSSSGSNVDASSRPNKSRRVAVTTANAPWSRSPYGVLVGETPRKGSARKHRLRDGTARPENGNSVERPVDESRIADSKPRTMEASAGQFPDSPSGKTRFSHITADSVVRQRAVDYASPQFKAVTSKGGMSSPASREAASAATRLFVAESPGAGAPIEIRRALRSAYTGGEAGGACSNLMSDSASPAPQRRSVVPDTPA